MFLRIYFLFACLGVMSVPGAFLLGFRHDRAASLSAYGFNIGIYLAFMAVHIVLTIPAVKKVLVGRPEGSPTERRVYITLSVLTWLAVYALHRPVPGFHFEPAGWLRLLGICAMLLGVFAFFEFADFAALASLFGVPDAQMTHTAAASTPLLREGSYAKVRHPMYRASIFLYFSSLLIHPHAGQLLFALMVVGSFLLFIPFEEKQLLRSRGEEYRSYQQQVPWRVLPGLW